MPIVFGFGLYALILLCAVAAAVIGLFVGPRPWAQRLCKWTLWLTGTFLALLAAALLCFALAGVFRAEVTATPILLFAFLLCSPLLIVFLGLLTIWLGRVSSAARQGTR